MSSSIFDIETGPIPTVDLLLLYREPTLEEFSESCDARWKPETKAAKWEEAKASGWAKFVDKAALSPITGQVLAIGYCYGDGTTRICGDVPEPEILIDFWQHFTKALAESTRLVGFNSNSFDVPFIVRRSWLHGLDVPSELMQGRDLNKAFVDLMETWNLGERGFVSLNTLGRYLGIGQKPEGVGGGDFAKLWQGSEEDKAKAIAYLENDLKMTKALAGRLHVY